MPLVSPQEVLKDKLKIAIIGASDNVEKYGNRILRNLNTKGYELYPINPKQGKIFDLKVYATVNDLPVEVDIFNFVVPPNITLEILKDIKHKAINKPVLWFQPGSYNKEVTNFLESMENDHIVENCIMTESTIFLSNKHGS